jgi:AcrR family transcriptional regulator
MRKSKTTGTREQLLEAAMAAIERSGETGVRIDEIAETVGVSKASIYHFFDDREGLVTAALGEAYRRAMRRGLYKLDALLECDSQNDFLSLLVGDVPTFAAKDGMTSRRKRIQILGSAVTRPALKSMIRLVHQETVDDLAKYLQYGQRRGWIKNEFDAKIIAEWWLGLILGRHLLDDYGDDPGRSDWATVTLTAVQALIIDSTANSIDGPSTMTKETG